MSSRSEPKYVYCIVKSAALRKKNGEFICSIPFSGRFRVFSNMGKGRLYGEFYKHNGNGYVKHRGFTKASGFSRHRVINLSRLPFKNITGKKIPTAVRYKGAEEGYISPDERVSALAIVNGWMLTSKGWTKAHWLKKERISEEPVILRDLLCGVITMAVSDYRKIVEYICKGKESTKDFPNLRAEFRMIRKMFIDGDYNRAMGDSVTGADRLMMIDKEIGVTEEWIREVMKEE